MAQLRLFGHPGMERVDSSRPLGMPSKGVALIALVAANASRPLSREWLAERLWPDCEIADARANLRRHLHLAVKALEHDVFLVSRQNVQWNAACGLGVDAIAFDRCCANDPSGAIAQYTGTFCDGIEDETLSALRDRYASAYEDCLRRSLATARTQGDTAMLMQYLHRIIAHDPLAETSVRELMTLRFEMGDRAGALRTYNELADRLHREIDAAPSAETTALYETILYDTESAGVPTNLAASRTSLIGRELDVESLTALLRGERLISLVGPGGIGKTRLAIATALMNLGAFADGVWFAELPYVSTRETVLKTICAALGARAHSDADGLAAALGRRRVLLILDNCEHVLQEAREIVEVLLERTQTTILVTSRRKLGAPLEYVYEVHGLEVPASRDQRAESLRRYSAARLFMDRACTSAPALRLTDENAPTVAEIVSCLDGIPLAIELVAARSNMLTLEGMRKRMTSTLSLASRRSGSATTRHATMEQALRWSYDLLGPAAQLLFRRLYIFPAPWDLEACEAICSGGEITPPQILDLLSELLDASLIGSRAVNDAVHYALLQPIRQFAESLARSAEEHEELLRRHAHYYIALAHKHDDPLEGHGEAYLRAMVDAEENLRLALRTAMTCDDLSGAATLLIAVSPYWGRSAQHGEIGQALSRLLDEHCLQKFDSDTRARLLRAGGRFAFGRGEWTQAIRLDLEAGRLFEEIGKPYNALVTRLAANIAAAYTATPLRDRIDEHKRILARVQELGAGSPSIAGELQSDLASMHSGIGDKRTALEYALSGLEILRIHGRRDREAMLLTITARIYSDLGEPDKGLECAREAVRIFSEIGEESTLGEAYRNLALAQMAADAPAEEVFSTLRRAMELHARREEARFTLYATHACMRAFAKYGFMQQAARALGQVLAARDRANYNRRGDPIPDEREVAAIESAVGAQFATLVGLGRLDSVADLQAALRGTAEGHAALHKHTIAS